MKKQTLFLLLTVLLSTILFGWTNVEDKWIVEKQNGYSLYYTTLDKQDIVEYKAYFVAGKKTVEDFFQNSFKNDFSIYIHPSRSSLDSAWQKDWNMPDFKSQCWMVASGVSNKLDIISPKKWDSLACEHSYSDSIKTLRLITHELVHVYHGQQNKSPDFSDVTGIDWFVEGLAVYASGQCDSVRISEVKKAISENRIPETLDKFWTGNLKYGLSGTVVLYLDKKFGREQIISLLNFNNIEELLNTLNTTEFEIMNGWRDTSVQNVEIKKG
ncbi:MAG: hypothetical protein HGGPFJEG_02869 [Ignavibacteria bacterium]|nr:hypothetical protein [Ignavibacteria bacterium]